MQIGANTKIMLAHVAWMKWYEGLTYVDAEGRISEDIPLGGGSYPAKEKVERYNYKVFDNNVYGFVEPNRGTQIININKLGALQSDEKIDDICVVFYAPDYTNGKNNKGTVIVGFYLNAIVYRKYETHVENGSREYNLTCDPSNAFLFEECSRPKINITNKRNTVIYDAGSVTDKDKLTDLINLYLTNLEIDDDSKYQAGITNCTTKINYADYVSASSIEPTLNTNQKNSKAMKKNPSLGKAVIEKNNYKCAYCVDHCTFESRSTMKPYMEAHHLIPGTHKNAEYFWNKYSFNIDSPENLVPLCPTCHRAIHYGTSNVQRSRLEVLFQKQKQGYEDKNLQISLDELFKLYSL